ncbi:phage tail tube protein [Janibacter melonis]|uniref:phage tail tube protein n=1 Tax=Janibacter melonis TaxID=262209 RepID=UPI00174B4DC6|nr:hypothetical protein [Janibacter melonis]
MVLNVPTGIPAAGKLSVTIIPRASVTNLAAITVAQATAPTAVNASCHLQGDGYGRTTTESTGTGRRACDDYEYDIPGPKKTEFDALRFVYDPQNPDAEVSKVYAALTEGEEYVIVERIGISGKTELAAQDYYNAYPMRVSVKEQMVPGADGELEFTVNVRSTGAPVKDAQIASA